MTRRICPSANPFEFLIPQPGVAPPKHLGVPETADEPRPKRLQRKAGWSALRRRFHPDR